MRGHGVCTGQKTFSCDQSTSRVGDSQVEKQAHVREKVLIKGFVLNPKDSKQVSNLIRVALRSRISQKWFEKNKLESGSYNIPGQRNEEPESAISVVGMGKETLTLCSEGKVIKSGA